MKIFDAHISGSLSVSSSAEIEGNLTVLGTLFATVSGTTTNALTASEAPRYTLTSSFHSFTSSYTTGSFTGSFIGDGSNLYNIPASGVTGLNLNKITSGSVSASISPDRGLEVNTDLNVVGIITAKEIHTSIVTSSVLFESGSTIFGNTLDDTHQITGSVGVTGSLTLNNDPVVVNTTFNSYTSSANGRLNAVETSTGALNTFSSSTDGRLSAIETSTSSLNSFTSSINTTIKNKLNTENVVSGSIQILFSGTTGYSDFSSSVGFTTITIENRVGSLETESGSVRTALNTFTSSANGRLSSIETSTGSLNTFSSSTNTRLNSIETSTGSLNSFSSSTLSSLSAIHTSTGSLNTFSSSTLTRLTNLESASSSIRTDFNSYTSSADGRLSSIETSTGSLNTFSSSTLTRLSAIETSTGSLNSYTSSNTTVIGTLQTATGALNTFSSSTNTRLNSIESSTSSLNTFTSSAVSRLTSIETSTGSLNSYTSSNTNNINAIHTATSSLNSYTSSNNTTLGTLQTATGALNTFSSSANTRLNAIETSTSSLNSFTSSIDTTIKNKLNTEGVISGSVQVTLSSTTGYSTFSSSLATTDAGQDSRLTSLEGKTGSYATTGSNVFIGDQTITGSLYISQNLLVGGSSSIQNISSSQLNIGTNLITVNTLNPGVRFGGLAVIDSGSNPQVSGSVLFDSVNDQWIFVHQAVVGAAITSSVLLMGPQTYNSLGSELYPTTNRLVKSINAEHLGDSSITDTGTKVSINSNTEITGTFVATGTALVSGSSQISFNGITDKPTLVSGSSQITFLSISSIPSGLVSGSSQVLNGSGVWSGSAQLPSGVVSGSSQVLAGTTIHSGAFFNGISVVSGSAQISFNGITDKPTLVSGSSQITYGSISGIPSGIVSGSSQISFGSISGIPSGLVSGSSQISFGSISGVPSGLVSGSSQIAFGSITGVPSGLVSGSSQITLSSTTGFGSYLNQAVLTSSSPTFAAITIGKSGTDSTITFPAQTNDPGYIKHYESNNTAIMYFNVSDDANDEFNFGYTAAPSTFRLRSDGVVLAGTWQGSSISTSYTDAKVTSVNAGTGISVNATTGAVTITNTITNNNQLTNGAGYITSYTETDTLATVTGRGASTSTAISINNELTVTSGRVTIRTGGANTYGIVSGYDNNNHLMTMRANIAGSTSSPTYTAGHQMCFVEYAEANDTTGWFFKTSQPGTYTEVARITRSTFNYNGNTVWHAGNDGSGTGLDADLLDGYHETSFVRLAASSSSPTNGTFAIGSASGRNFIQSHSSQPLDLNPLGNTVFVNGNQVVTNTGSWSISISGSAGSLSSMNISQFTNNSGYLTSVSLTSNVTGTLPVANGGTAATTRKAASNSIANFGQLEAHGTYTDLNSVQQWGGTYVQGSTNGHGFNGSTQYYQMMLSLGSDYDWGSGNTYAAQIAFSRNVSTPYIGIRYKEGGANTSGWNSWQKISAGYADTAGALSSMNISQFTNNSGYATLSGSNSFTNSYNEFGDGTGSVSNDGGWNGRLNLAGSQHARLDVTSVSDGIITTMYSHTGHAAGRVGTMSNHDLLLMINGSGKVRLSTSGHLSPEANGTQNLGSSSYRWNTVFTSDLSMSNGIGDYTIVEGEEDLFIYNNKNNKVFKFLLQEVDPSIVPPKKI